MKTPEQIREQNRRYYAANKAAIRAQQLRYRSENREATRAGDRAHRLANWPKVYARQRACKMRKPERTKQYAANYFATNKPRLLVYDRKKRGLPEPTRPEPPACELCGSPQKNGRAMALDHCHVTGKFRGWLCTRCNTGLGKLGDNKAGVARALKYLDENG